MEILVILTTIGLLTPAVTLDQPQNVSNILYIRTNFTIFTIVPDQFDPNNIFVGARNHILRINSSLNILDSVQNGPQNDNYSCAPHLKDCIGSMSKEQDNLIVFLTNDTDRRVISCGTLFQGMCSVHDYNNLSSYHFIGDSSDQANYIVSRRSTLVTQLPRANEAIFMVVHNFDGRPLHLSPPTLSLRRLDVTTSHHFQYLHSDSLLNVVDNLKRNYDFDVVYSFIHERFLYIISNQNQMQFGHYQFTRNRYFVRIGRICLEDERLNSYTESNLLCQVPPSELFRPSVAITAHFGDFKPKKSAKEGKSHHHLYVVFSESKMDHVSFVCRTTIDDINSEFEKMANNCINGISSQAELHPAFCFHNLSNYDCQPGDFTENCPRKTPKRIFRANLGLDLTFFMTFRQKIISFTSFQRGKRIIALAATDKGVLLKLSLDSPANSTILFQQNFTDIEKQCICPADSPFDGEIPEQHLIKDQGPGAKPRPVMTDDEHVFFAFADTIVKFPANSCSIYSRCVSCLLQLDCGWCDGHCASTKECPKNEEAKCPPVIDSITPSSGPLEGGTKITIRGDSFGRHNEETNNVSLILANETSIACPIIQIFNDEIVCQLDVLSGLSPTSAAIVVKVGDHSIAAASMFKFGYKIGGEVRRPQAYHFKKVRIDSILVILDGKGLSIKGSNLNVGMKRRVSVNYSIDGSKNVTDVCDINFSVEKQIICKISGNFTGTHGSALVTIDAWNLRVSCNDTLVQSLNPKTRTDNIINLIVIIFTILMMIIAAIWVTFRATRKYLIKRKFPLEPCPGLSLIDIDRKKLELLAAANKIIYEEDLIDPSPICEALVGSRAIYRAQLRRSQSDPPREIAMKTLTTVGSLEPLKNLIDEALIMKDFDHPNVLSLVGLILSQNKFPVIVTEFMEKYDLKHYLAVNKSSVTLPQSIQFILNIARGMEYIARLKLVHRDLAARNCMVDKNLNVRVADFGLSKCVNDGGDYNSQGKSGSKRPYKWMSPESRTSGTFSEKTDIWSFAVTAWEVLTR